MATTHAIDEAVRRIVAECDPSRIILFGSHARRDHTEDSDLDFLVITRVPVDRRAEMIHLQERLRGLGMPVDVLVFSEREIVEWGDVRNRALSRFAHRASQSAHRSNRGSAYPIDGAAR